MDLEISIDLVLISPTNMTHKNCMTTDKSLKLVYELLAFLEPFWYCSECPTDKVRVLMWFDEGKSVLL